VAPGYVLIQELGAVSLAFGLAFGLGGRGVAAQITQSWYKSSQATAARVRTKAAQPKPAVRHRPASETR